MDSPEPPIVQSGGVTIAVDNSVSNVPMWPALVIPVLTVLSAGETMHRKDIFDAVAKVAGLGSEARAEMLNSGGYRYEQRMGWVLSHLSKAGWVDRPARGYYAINDEGRLGLSEHPEGFDYSQAREFFARFWPSSVRGAIDETSNDGAVAATVDILDPVEQIEDGISRIEQEFGEELLERLRGSHPDFFEQAVVDLLLAMGYGGAEQRGKRIGGPNDEGIDGIIDQDALGLDRIYVQAKRYKDGNNIGRETIQAFVGALHGFGATRGVFLTTSAFTPAAVDYSRSVQSRVILIDGQRLVALMIKYRVGVQIKQKYTTVEIDADFFD
ncbi:restriction endonuclease [Homoserinimonas sp. OAct 916]|uniref:restriction endonuclease n=1 Tax=Homoserinimonas sp. OAct 916 TaxID=2211450 RepID=UPI0018E517AF|nr:restriction endonuclease [Homoserinimonas sp. OAct 916]